MKAPRIFVFLLVLALLSTSAVYADAFKHGNNGQEVKKIQTQLKKLGYFNSEITGYFGNVTESAVKKFQTKSGLKPDGIVGTTTYNALFKVKSEVKNTAAKPASSTTASKNSKVELLDWWTQASKIFRIGTVAKVTDVKTGKSFNIVRSYGSNHADCETKTAADTKIMKEIFGGSWNWERRPIIIQIGSRKLAASMAGMPHAGVDSKTANATVSSRSGGYGRGANLDKVKGNNMSGVFDVHFLNSRTHGTNRVDPKHQKCVMQAAGKLEL